MRMHASFLTGILLLAVSAASISAVRAADKKPVKVFILAGQSNMEGKAKNKLLDHQATAAKTKEIEEV